jgi:type IV secretion system protein VirB10
VNPPEAGTEVQGERTVASVGQNLSAQSRVSNFLALGLICLLGMGMLAWYYGVAMSRPGRARAAAQTQSIQRASGDLPLPSIGRIDPPSSKTTQASPLEPSPLRELPLQSNAVPQGAGGPAAKTPEELTQERLLSGAAFATQSGSSVPALTASAAEAAGNAGTPVPQAAATTADNALATLLRPTVVAPVQAKLLPTQRLLLAKGAFIDCTLETAIDSTLPGMTTCIVATDTFGVDGKVILLERGTKLVGETRGDVAQGASRVFVLWNEARTPAGVIVPLASPGTDELGRAGLPGEVNRHFWQRFGAALLVSIIDGVVQGSVASSRGTGTVVVNPSATQDVMTEILKGTINIPPTVVKHQGDRIQVLVAHDLDFRSVYALAAARPATRTALHEQP